MKVYLDNAATTPMHPEVLDTVLPFFTEKFGNPSSVHTHGREVRSAVEKSRKTVAELLNTSPSEIFFTSGGTEADNTALRCTVKSENIQHIISSRLEHHAVTDTLEMLSEHQGTQISFLNHDKNGNLDLNHLEELLQKNPKSLVSIMQGNNEIGNLADLEKIGEICDEHKAVLHSDTVQTVGHFRHDLQKLKVNFMVGSAHKFHGPKGIGFLYVNGNLKIQPFIRGGAQERNMRGGTENVCGIIGLAKALEITCSNLEKDQKYIQTLKDRMINGLKECIEGVAFNGMCESPENSLYTVLNVSLPPSEINEMLLFKLDIAGISASGGSACTSGSEKGSHVLHALGADPNRAGVRFSFSKYNTPEEIDYTVKTLAEMYSKISA